MKRYTVAMTLCCSLLLLAAFPGGVSAGLDEAVRSFLSVKGARSLRGGHEALNFGTDETPRFVVVNHVAKDVLSTNGEPPSYALNQDKVFDPEFRWKASSWSGCDTQCGPGTMERTYSCVDRDGNAVDPLDCDGEMPAAEQGGCEIRPCLRSCKDVLEHDPEAATGAYSLDGPNGPFTAQCEMDTDGGGWTNLALSYSGSDLPNILLEGVSLGVVKAWDSNPAKLNGNRRYLSHPNYRWVSWTETMDDEFYNFSGPNCSSGSWIIRKYSTNGLEFFLWAKGIYRDCTNGGTHQFRTWVR